MEKPIIRTSRDLERLENYLPSIDPKAQPMRRIVTHYYLNALFPCGLKNCHQPHKDGFLVELEDGHLSNVGWKCGEHFGDKFATERRRYAEQELRPNAIRAVQEVVQIIQGMRDKLGQIAASADRLSQYKQGLRTQFPKLYRDLERRASDSNDRVSEQVERPEKEIDDLQAMNPGSGRERFRYRDELRGVLPGLRVLRKNIREEVVTKFTGKVEALLFTDIASLSTDKLLEWEGWALRFGDSMAEAQGLIGAGNAFFTPECFHLLTYVTTVHSEKIALSKLTVAALIKAEHRASDARSEPTEPTLLTKKQRDSQKRLAAIQRNAGRLSNKRSS